ncbi:MAG: permease-like cell division protein FtsX [Actinomycetes bacterium]|jgi:cell division transport system permease protein|nr:permease-like cell division protein FtsX [Actinomycetes bacterium]
MSINVGYFLSEAGTSFRRNWVMSFGAVVTIFLSLLLIGSSVMLSMIANSMVQGVESKVSIQLFIKDDAAEPDINVLERTLSTNALVKSVAFVSKEEALTKFKVQMKESPEVIENLEGNPLPASLDVELKDSRNVEKVVKIIKDSPEFPKIADRPDRPEQSLKYGQQIIKALFRFTRIIRYVGSVFVIMLVVVALIFINNTIRLAIYARRNELSIMRLVGASNWFIRAPFILEGILQSLIGATLAILVISAVRTFALPKIQAAIPMLHVSVTNVAVGQISGILIGVGIFIGIIGSWLAMRRYLKV